MHSVVVYGNKKRLVHIQLPVRHIKMPVPGFKDTDGDGVPDQLDLEPNSPPGTIVDTHGRALDTDGDGVPDYKDKEKLTLQKCFPVDSNGVGTCPEPACCKVLRENDRGLAPPGVVCHISNLPSVQFKNDSSTLTEEAARLLYITATELKVNPDCNVKIIGYIGGVRTEKTQQLSWDRVNTIVKYLVEKQGISQGRLIFMYGEKGYDNVVDLIPTAESHPGIPPSPSPKHR
jgi:outer membrane protein OmpA-like peptidoglycan-associated protein